MIGRLRPKAKIETLQAELAIIVARLGQAVARENLDIMGKRISVSQDAKGVPAWNEIVGVVANIRDLNIHDEAEPEYFLPLCQSGVGSHHLVVRTRTNPETLADTISRQIWASFPDQPVTNVSLDKHDREVSRRRTHAHGASGHLRRPGISSGAAGCVRVVSYSVARRSQEIGVRAALGASRVDLLGMALRGGLTLVACGALLGAAGAFAAVRVISGELYGVKPSDPWTYAVAAALMMMVGVVASWVPARRAMQADPMAALRYE